MAVLRPELDYQSKYNYPFPCGILGQKPTSEQYLQMSPSSISEMTYGPERSAFHSLEEPVQPPQFFEPSIVLSSPPRRDFFSDLRPGIKCLDSCTLKRSFDGNLKAAPDKHMPRPSPLTLLPIMGRYQTLLNSDLIGPPLPQAQYGLGICPNYDLLDETYGSAAPSIVSGTSPTSPEDFETLLSTLWTNVPLDQLLDLCFRKEVPRPSSIPEPASANDSGISSLDLQACLDCRNSGEAEPICRTCAGKGTSTKTRNHSKANMERRAWHKFFLLWLHKLVPDELLKECGYTHITRIGAAQGPTKDVLLKASVLHIQKLIDAIHLLREKSCVEERAIEQMQKDLAKRDIAVHELQLRLTERDDLLVSWQKQQKEKDLYQAIHCSGPQSKGRQQQDQSPPNNCAATALAVVTNESSNRTHTSPSEILSTPATIIGGEKSQAFKWKPNITVVHQRKKRRRNRAGDSAEVIPLDEGSHTPSPME